jgi:hypothetical protein
MEGPLRELERSVHERELEFKLHEEESGTSLPVLAETEADLNRRNKQIDQWIAVEVAGSNPVIPTPQASTAKEVATSQTLGLETRVARLIIGSGSFNGSKFRLSVPGESQRTASVCRGRRSSDRSAEGA